MGSVLLAHENQQDPVLSCSLVHSSWWLWVGASLSRNLSRSVGHTCAHRCVALLEEQLCPGSVWLWRAVPQVQFRAQIEIRRLMSQVIPWFLWPEISRWVPLSRKCGLTCAHMCATLQGDQLSSEFFIMNKIIYLNWSTVKSYNIALHQPSSLLVKSSAASWAALASNYIRRSSISHPLICSFSSDLWLFNRPAHPESYRPVDPNTHKPKILIWSLPQQEHFFFLIRNRNNKEK